MEQARYLSGVHTLVDDIVHLATGKEIISRYKPVSGVRAAATVFTTMNRVMFLARYMVALA
jgi:hypothetical protein